MIEWGTPVRTLGTDFDRKADALLTQIDKALKPAQPVTRKLSDLFGQPTPSRDADISASLDAMLREDEGAVL